MRPLALLLVLALAVPAAADAPERFALALYHFNVQFVSGDEKAEDAVVVESFLPLVDLYLRHPEWGADFELSGKMVEVLARRHPGVLERFRTLLGRGRCEAVSFHWSDQLLLAFPAQDMRVSLELVFCQEAQVGDGIHRLMEEAGRRTIVWTTGNWRFFRPEGELAPWYADGRVRVVVGGEVRHDAVHVVWTRLGDGEPVATGSTPYALYGVAKRPFRFDPARLAEYEGRLAGLEAGSWRIASVSAYVRHLEEAGIEPEPMGEVLETARQGNSRNVFTWMGEQVHPLEDDYEVLTRAYRARTEVRAAELALAHLRAAGGPRPELEAAVEDAWRRVLEAEVSDATGWVPLSLEVRTSLARSREAMATASAAIERVKADLGARALRIDLETGRVESLAELPAEPAPRRRARGPVEVRLDGPVIDRRIEWFDLGGARRDVELEFLTPAGLLAPVEISFPRAEGPFAYAPALVEDRTREIDLSRAAFDGFWLALPSGLVRLAPRLWLVKHCRVGHLALGVAKGDRRVRLRLEGPGLRRYRFRFTLFEGEEVDALELARRINTHPVLVR